MIARDPDLTESALRDFTKSPGSNIRPFIGFIGERDEYLVTAIGPKLAVTAKHIGIRDNGQEIRFPSLKTRVVETIQADVGDFTFFRLADSLVEWPELYRGESLVRQNPAGESISPVVWAGNGRGRGAELRNSSGELIGWDAGGDCALRWAINYIDRYDNEGVRTIPTLQARFQMGSGRDAQACPGDSGGPCFVSVNGQLRFAGVVISDGGTPYTFGKIGMVASLITGDLAKIEELNADSHVVTKPQPHVQLIAEPVQPEQPTSIESKIRVRITVERQNADGSWSIIQG